MTLCPEQTQTHPSFLPFLVPSSFHLLVFCQISTIHASFLFPTSFLPSPTFCFCPLSFLASYPLLIPYLLLSSLLLSDLFVCLYAGSVLPCLLPCWCLFFLTSFSRYLPPSFPFNLFLKVFYFLSKLLFPSLYLSFFPYPLSFHSLFSTLFPLSFFDSLTVFFPLYTLISFFVTFIHFLPPSFLFPCLAYLPSSPCFLFPSLLSLFPFL